MRLRFERRRAPKADFLLTGLDFRFRGNDALMVVLRFAVQLAFVEFLRLATDFPAFTNRARA